MRQLILFLVLVWSVPAAAADIAGTWKMTAEGQTALLLTVERADGDRATGKLVRPEGMEIDDGTSVSNLTGRASERILASSEATAEQADLRLSPAKPGEDKLQFILRALDDNHAELIIAFDGQSARPISLRRASPGDTLFSGWANHSYTIDANWPDNAEMKAMFEADQAGRKVQPIDWDRLSVEDSKRRARTADLVAQGKLRSASDFYAAAFIFQHGDQASDYMLAHNFALIAASKGEPAATWIAAATLDRYLQKIGQPQIYGTQYFTRSNEPVTQEPYNRTLISDALRRELRVPPIAEQEQRRQAMQASRNAKP
jgi:hypothetical protein